MIQKTIDLTSHPNPALSKVEQNDEQPCRGETRRRETKSLNDPSGYGEKREGEIGTFQKKDSCTDHGGKDTQVRRPRVSMLYNPGPLKGGVGQVEEHIGAGLIIDFCIDRLEDRI